MTFKELAENRFSVRSFSSQMVEKEKINYVLECARLAPSATNNQPWHFYVVSSEEGRAQIQKAYNREWFKSVPLYIIVCGNHNESWKRSNTDNKDYCDVDVAIAAEHLCLSATEIGLGTCWVCNFESSIIADFLNLTTGFEPIAIFPIGYIKDDCKSQEKKRKSVEMITTWL